MPGQKPINIFLYEDSIEYRNSFKLAAQKQRILVDASDNVDNLLEALEENSRKHKFVVLDARAFLHEGQAGGSETEANLHVVIREIERIAKKQDRVIPYCVNTGFAEIRLTHKEVLQCPIFEKGEEDNLFEYIWKTYNETDSARLRMRYPDIFEVADLYFDDPNMEVLSALLNNSKYKSDRVADKVSNLASLRRLLEHVMDIIYINHLNEQQGIINNQATRVLDITHYLKDQGAVPPQVFGAVVNIQKIASNFGSHTPEKASQIADFPTHHTIKSLTSGLFEVIIWASKLL